MHLEESQKNCIGWNADCLALNLLYNIGLPVSRSQVVLVSQFQDFIQYGFGSFKISCNMGLAVSRLHEIWVFAVQDLLQYGFCSFEIPHIRQIQDFIQYMSLLF